MHELGGLRETELFLRYCENMEELEKRVRGLLWHPPKLKEGDRALGHARKSFKLTANGWDMLYTRYYVFGVDTAKIIQRELGAYVHISHLSTTEGRSSYWVYGSNTETLEYPYAATRKTRLVFRYLEQWQVSVAANRSAYGENPGDWVGTEESEPTESELEAYTVEARAAEKRKREALERQRDRRRQEKEAEEHQRIERERLRARTLAREEEEAARQRDIELHGDTPIWY